MKSMLRKPLASLLLLAAMVALAIMTLQPAAAADLPLSFKATTLSNTPTTITPEYLASFECGGGQVVTVREDTNPAWYFDANGALCTKLKNQPNFAQNWVNQPGTDRWFQVKWYSMQCSSGGTQMTYRQNLPELGDGCQLDTLVKAKSN
jgi:ABC-type transport system substrate-binding protein